ncbi:MAG: HAD family phosphatase [Gammaproteobacteria bacterium]|nr:HAD family phosphatase [Gammaproteobacteria bacterium]MBT3724751.1 HAD family phosphatase [Gammaproteobacteria bacterium]MBT4195500.1 HAD family phosphatase [Gammaproteobacteria bacterium]MBT4448778.1 HAD family phosphatase [Gammaproteobacteria bacterium]MBT4860630.1 HAD family phosphatase [Gammaproteobacteria bacterium]
MNIKAILFDHDGTLVDSETIHYEMWKIILESYGITLTLEDYIQNYAGFPTISNAETMTNRYSALSVTASVLIDAKNSATKLFLSTQAFPLMKGARESINYFKEQGLKVSVVTGASGEGVKNTINSYDLKSSISTVVSGDDVRKSKPAPDCYLLATQRLGLHASECIAIEDSENGVAAAVAANVTCVAVSGSMLKHHDFSKAVKVFTNLDEARHWIVESYEFI